MYKQFYPFALLFCVALVTGCGDGTVQSSGTVKFSNGEPVPFGIIFFENPQFSYRGTIQDGTYQIEGLKRGSGLPPGSYRVYVIGDNPETELSLFDAKYTSPDTSGLVVEVEKGKENVFDITVEKSTLQRAVYVAPTGT